MPRRSLLAAALAAAVGALALAVPPGLAAQAAPVRVMPLGDSITGSPGCWRAILWESLQTAGHTNVDFVGTLPPQGCGVAHDGDNEGHGGILATNMASQNQLPAWLSATNPDVVLMHLGTNDVWSNRTPQQILAAFTTLVGQMRANNPAMRIIIAKIIPMNPSTCAECGARVVAFNDAIPAWASGLSTTQSPIVVVDQWTGFSTGTDTYDGVHPNAAGDRKIADRWVPALAAALGGGTLPTTDPTVGPTPGASATSTDPPPAMPTDPPPLTPTGGPASECTATYAVVGQWQGAFQGEVAVRNSGAAPLSGATVTWTFADGQEISQIWNGSVAQSGATVTAASTGALGAGASATFGFIADWTGRNTAPALSCTAG